MSYASDFRAAFLSRTMHWKYVSELQANRLADFALAQAKFESANFTSNVFKKNMNPIGYKTYKGSLWQIGSGSASPEGDTYGVFPSVQSAAGELADWIHRRPAAFDDIETLSQYVSALKSFGYFGDNVTTYLNGCLSYYTPEDYSAYSDQEIPGSSFLDDKGGDGYAKFTLVQRVMILCGALIIIFIVTGRLRVPRVNLRGVGL